VLVSVVRAAYAIAGKDHSSFENIDGPADPALNAGRNEHDIESWRRKLQGRKP
jgi:hypothetical protein